MSKWVLGQQSALTVNGTVTSSTTYDANTALPAAIYTFGLLRQSLTYNPDGTLATVKDGNNNVTSFGNWSRGVPQTIHYADNTTQSATVDDNGQITSITDANGFATGYGYDAMGRLAAITYPSESTFGYNNKTIEFRPLTASDWMPSGYQAGQWRRYEVVGNHATVTYYDSLWRPTLVNNYDASNVGPTLQSTRMSYDVDGKMTFKSYPTGDIVPPALGTWTGYDVLGRVTSVSQDTELSPSLQITTTEYLSGYQTRVTDPKGNQTTTSYLTYDEPTTDHPVMVVQPEGAVVSIARDQFDQPTAVTRRNSDGSVQITRQYLYGTVRRLCMVIEPETGATVFGYDGASNLTQSASGLPAPTSGLSWPDSGTTCGNAMGSASARVVNRTYDTRNRLSSLSFPDGRGNQTWTYTPDGLPATTTTNNDNGANQVINAYSYNRRRLLTGESVSQPGWYTWGIGYGYDGNASLTTTTYPDGLVINYAPNALGQPTQVGTFASGISYYPNGAVSQFTYGNGIVHGMIQNVRKLPSRSTDQGALDLSYSYDANANVGQITDNIDGRQTRSMVYDGQSRLKQAASNMWGVANYSYDVLDNLTHAQVGASANYPSRDYYYTYDGNNRLSNVHSGSVGGSTVIGLAYDVQGNLSNKNGQAYDFDYGNRLRSVSGKEAYRYDGLGRRVLAWSPALGNIISQYSLGGQLLYTSNERIGVGTEYIYLGGSLVAQRENSSTGTVIKYQHTDALSSPIATTDTNKAIIEKTEYEPYGAQTNRALKDGPNFTGHVLDSATGLDYMQQRYYDPMIGRFLSVDPVAANSNTGSVFNRYDYAFNNPYRFTDPDGRFAGESPGACSGSQTCTTDTPPPKDQNILGVVVVTASKAGKAIKSGAESAIRFMDPSVNAQIGGALGQGATLSGNYQLLTGKKKLELEGSIGEGLYGGVYGEVTVAKLHLPAFKDAPVYLKSGEIKIADYLAAGIKAEFNPGGQITIKLSGGFGFGEKATVNTPLSLAWTIWESK